MFQKKLPDHGINEIYRMNSKLKYLLLQWLPPGFINIGLSSLDLIRPANYEFVSYEWPKQMDLKGWQAKGVGEEAEKKWAHFLESMKGSQPLGIEKSWLEVPDLLKIHNHNLFISYAYCLSLACRNKCLVSVLDWGGGTGHYSVIAKSVIPDVEFDYHCVDLPSSCKVGRKLLPEVTFHDSDTWQHMTYDFVFSSSALQYLEDWRPTLQSLIKSTKRYLYITRMPFVNKARSFVVVQRVKEYGTEYLGWVLNKHEFIKFAEAQGLTLKREFVNYPGERIRQAPERNIHMGFLFEKAA